MSHPSLAIVIPHKNTPEKLRRLLLSISDEASVATIVVDDNSAADKSAFRLRKEFPRVIFLLNSPHCSNAGSARNLGLSAVETEWVLFADADDFFLPHGIDSVLTAISAVSSTVDLVYFNGTSLNEMTGISGTRHLATSSMVRRYVATGSEMSLRYYWPRPSQKAIRVSLIRSYNIQFDSVPAANDVMFSLLCGHHATTIACCDKSVYCITESSGSLTARTDPTRAMSRLGVLIRKNTCLMTWRIDGHIEWGLSYFLKSKPLSSMLTHPSLYYDYACYIAVRLLYALRKLVGLFFFRNHSNPL